MNTNNISGQYNGKRNNDSISSPNSVRYKDNFASIFGTSKSKVEKFDSEKATLSYLEHETLLLEVGDKIKDLETRLDQLSSSIDLIANNSNDDIYPIVEYI